MVTVSPNKLLLHRIDTTTFKEIICNWIEDIHDCKSLNTKFSGHQFHPFRYIISVQPYSESTMISKNNRGIQKTKIGSLSVDVGFFYLIEIEEEDNNFYSHNQRFANISNKVMSQFHVSCPIFLNADMLFKKRVA